MLPYKKHIILDIDGTLIDSDDYHIYPRPYLHEFFEFIFDKFETVSIWTASSQYWYNKVYETVFKKLIPHGKSFFFTWFGNRCNYKIINPQDCYGLPIKIKKIKKVTKKYKFIKKKDLLIIDDAPETYSCNYGNAIPILSYNKSNENDDKLKRVINLLQILLEQDSILHTNKQKY